MNQVDDTINDITSDLKDYCKIISEQDFTTTANIQTELLRSRLDTSILVWKGFFTKFSLDRMNTSFVMLGRMIVSHLKYPFTIYKTHQSKTDESKLKGYWEALKWTLGLPKFYINAEWVHFKDLD